jgi:uncharacterized protein DUF4232
MDKDRVRRFLERMADEAQPDPEVPSGLRRRATRRRARTITVGFLVVGLLGSGTFAGLQALTGINRQPPAGRSCGWVPTSVPNPGNVSNSLVSVSGVGAHDVWAVGSFNFKPGGYSPPPFPVGNPRFFGTSHAMAIHWDGRSWTSVGMPDPPKAGEGASLSSVLAINQDDVWAAGQIAIGGALYFEHWDGSVWKLVPSPVSGVDAWSGHAFAGTAGNDVWFVGTNNDGIPPLRTLTMHWDGVTWKVIPSPNLGTKGSMLTAVAAIRPDDVWAVGFAGHTPLAMHWNGTEWSKAAMPTDEPFYQLHGVAALPGGQLVAVATSYKTATERHQTLGLMLTGDGAHWRIAERHAGTDLRDVVAGLDGDAWIVGSSGWDSDRPLRPFLRRWDGQRTQAEDISILPLDAWVTSATTVPSGEMWVVGEHQTGVPTDALALHRPCQPGTIPSVEPTTPPSSPSNPKTIATTLTVPWAPIPPTPAPTPTVNARPCQAGDLKVAIGLEGAGMSFAGEANFENVSDTACFLTGRPDVALTGSDGQTLDVEIHPIVTDDLWPTQPLVVLEPGSSSGAVLQWRNWCGKRDDHVTWHVDLPDVGRFDVAGPGAGPFCNLPDQPSTLSVSAVRPQEVEDKWPLVPILPRDLSAVPGSDLHYVVILHNAGGKDYMFPEDCPAFEQTLTLPDGRTETISYTLSCGEAGTTPPDANVAFEMVIHVPEDAPSGEATLHWALDPPWGFDRSVSIAITTP